MKTTNPEKLTGLVKSINKFKANNATRKTQREQKEMGKNDSNNIISSKPIQQNMSSFVSNNNIETPAQNLAQNFVSTAINKGTINATTKKLVQNVAPQGIENTNDLRNMTASSSSSNSSGQISADRELAIELAIEEKKKLEKNENAKTTASDDQRSYNAPNKYFGKLKTSDILVPLVIDNRVLKIASSNADQSTYRTTNINDYEKIIQLEKIFGSTITGFGTLLKYDQENSNLIKYNDNKNIGNKNIDWTLIQIEYSDISDYNTLENSISTINDNLNENEKLKLADNKSQPNSTPSNNTLSSSSLSQSSSSSKTLSSTSNNGKLIESKRRIIFFNTEPDFKFVVFDHEKIKNYKANKEKPNTIVDKENKAYDPSNLKFTLLQCIINIGALANSIQTKLIESPTTIRGKFFSFLNTIKPSTQYTRDTNGFFKDTTDSKARLANLYLSIYKYIYTIDKSILDSNINNNMNDFNENQMKKGNKTISNEIDIDNQVFQLRRGFIESFNKNIKEIKGVEFIRTDRVFKSLTGGSKKNRFSKKRKNHANKV